MRVACESCVLWTIHLHIQKKSVAMHRHIERNQQRAQTLYSIYQADTKCATAKNVSFKKYVRPAIWCECICDDVFIMIMQRVGWNLWRVQRMHISRHEPTCHRINVSTQHRQYAANGIVNSITKYGRTWKYDTYIMDIVRGLVWFWSNSTIDVSHYIQTLHHELFVQISTYANAAQNCSHISRRTISNMYRNKTVTSYRNKTVTSTGLWINCSASQVATIHFIYNYQYIFVYLVCT